MAFSRLNEPAPYFEASTTQSVKKLTGSHIAWVRTIKEKFGVEVPFPIIADLSMQVAPTYGMTIP